MTDPTVVIALLCALGVGYAIGYGSVVSTLRAVEKIAGGVVAHGTAAHTFYAEEDGALIVSDPKASFDKAETLTDLLT